MLIFRVAFINIYAMNEDVPPAIQMENAAFVYEKDNNFVLFYSSMFILHKTYLYFCFVQGWVTIRDTVHGM